MCNSADDMGAIVHLDGERRWCQGSMPGRIRVEFREGEGKDGFRDGMIVELESVVRSEDVVETRNWGE